jgi:hypothetical protein
MITDVLAAFTVTATSHQVPNPIFTPELSVTEGGEPPSGL